MKQIEQMYTSNITDGKDYFLMQVDGGTVKTGIVTAKVTTTGNTFITAFNINFVLRDGDLNPGKLENVVYMAEID